MPLSARIVIYVLFLLSGATALVYQVAWTRSFSLIFGSSYEAVSIVLGAFMAGLALGSIYFGRRAAREGRSLRLYGFLELGIAASGLLIPWLLQLADVVYVSVALKSNGVNWAIHTLRVAMAFGILVIPTFFMGGTLPVLTRFLVRQQSEFGVRLAGLYGTNTIGAVVGVVASGFVLLPRFGVWRTQLLAVGANIVVGIVALIAARFLRQPSEEEASHDAVLSHEPSRAPQAAAGARLPWALRLAFLGAGVSGFCALALEVMWTRAISISTGLSTYSFTIMLSAFLTGISLGSWLHAVFPLRRIDVCAQLAAVFMVIGLSSFAVSQLIPQLPQWAMEMNVGLHGGKGVNWSTTLFLSLAIMLVPCTFMGIAFPLAGLARSRLVESVGKSVGSVLGLNTVGAILGSLLAGYVLIPSLGLQRGMLLISAAYFGYGVVLLATRSAEGTNRRWIAGLSAASALAVIACLPVAIRSWDLRMLGAFSHNSPGLYMRGEDVDVRGGISTTNLLYYREGRVSTVSVYELGGARVFQVDGKSEAGDALMDLHHELLLGHLPVLLHPEPRSAAMIGLGAGITLAAIAAHPSVDRMVIIEIEPAVLGAARQFDDVNDHVLSIAPPRLEVAYQDGRNYLLTTSEHFDVISADSIHPWVRGSSYLYTSEYYRMLVEHLTPRGILCQWLPIYELSTEDIKSVLATFAANLRHTQLWSTGNDALLMGSNAPIVIDVEDFERRLQVPAVSRQLGYVGLEDLLSLLAELTMGDQSLRSFAAGGVINTDDNLYLEFSSPLSVSIHQDVMGQINALQAVPADILTNYGSRFAGAAELQQTLKVYDQAKKETVALILDINTVHVEDWESRLQGVLERAPGYARAQVLLALMCTHVAEGLLSSGKPDLAASYCQKAVHVRPGFGRAHHVWGLVLMQQQKYREAADRFRKALECRAPRFWEAYEPLSVALERMGRMSEAIELLEQGLREKPGDPRMKQRLDTLQMPRGPQ